MRILAAVFIFALLYIPAVAEELPKVCHGKLGPENETVFILPGFMGSAGSSMFCNDPEAKLIFETALRTAGIDITLKNKLEIDPILKNYDKFIATLRACGMKKVRPAPYNWMIDVRDSTRESLSPLVDVEEAEGRAYHYVAHSMGGYLVREDLERHNRQHVKSVSYAATPHEGVVRAYYGEEGGRTIGPMLFFDRLLAELFLDLIKLGCGCGPISDVRLIQVGCPPKLPPVDALRNLMPIFPFLHDGDYDAPLIPIEEMCIQNDFLLEKRARNDIATHGDISFVFTGIGRWTPARIVRFSDPPADCERRRWPDGKPFRFPIKQRTGDKTVLLKSSCPVWMKESGVRCFVYPLADHSGKSILGEAVGDIISVIRNGTVTTTTMATTTTLAQGEACVKIAGGEKHTTFEGSDNAHVVAFTDLDNDGKLDDRISTDPEVTTWIMESPLVAEFFIKTEFHMGIQALREGQSLMRVRFDPDGDGPESACEDTALLKVL